VTSLADPGRPLLIFDGDCAFCTTSARAWQRWLHLEHVEPWQFLDLEPLGVTQEQCLQAVQWIDETGNVAAAERAVIAALRHAGGVWGVLGRVMNLPGVRHLAGLVYRLVARYRHRLPGGTPACKLPQS
jgi:predicted DCC family thiol-disulfide oxidoreductase YuxK